MILWSYLIFFTSQPSKEIFIRPSTLAAGVSSSSIVNWKLNKMSPLSSSWKYDRKHLMPILMNQ